MFRQSLWLDKGAKQEVTCWWNGNVDIAVKEERRLWQSWKQSGSKADYLEANKTARRGVYDALRAAKLERL